jgi:hypothetical protein
MLSDGQVSFSGVCERRTNGSHHAPPFVELVDECYSALILGPCWNNFVWTGYKIGLTLKWSVHKQDRGIVHIPSLAMFAPLHLPKTTA